MANSRNLTTTMAAGFTSKVMHPIMLCQIETASGTVNMWTGFGTITWNGIIFTGVGNFGGIDAVQETSDMSATSVGFSLSGIDPAMLEIALNEIQQGNNAYLWLGLLDSSGNLMADPYQLFSGVTDVPEIDETPDSCTIKLTCESRMADLNRARIYYYTPQDQAIFDSTDRGFDFVAALQQESIIFG